MEPSNQSDQAETVVIDQIQLGPEARDRVWAELLWGHSLASKIPKVKNIRLPVALVTRGTDRQRAMAWYSGKDLSPRNAFDRALANLLVNAARGRQLVLIAENYLEDITDPKSPYEPAEVFSFEGALYSYVNVSEDTDPILKCMEWATAFRRNLFVVEGPPLDLVDRQPIPSDMLDGLVSSTVMVAVDAYDGQSFFLAETRTSSDISEPRLLAF
ncbi:MAG TPA: hypothetical protein VIB78_13410 [Acidimicrobiia bacterium]|jgi:hypothetical protein